MRIDQLRHSKRYYIMWSQLRPFLANETVKYVSLVPLAGYLILFNDFVANYLSFDIITDNQGTLLFSTKLRLQFIYFGLCFLAVASVWFNRRCPEPVRLAKDYAEYRAFAFLNFTIYQFVKIYFYLERTYGFGLYDDTNFDRDNLYSFINSAAPQSKDSAQILEDDEIWFIMKDVTNANLALTESREFLSNLLDADFDYASHSKPIEATLLGVVTFLGAILISLPAIDVFVSISVDMLKALWGGQGLTD